MKRKEIEKRKGELDEILKEADAGVRLQKLTALAKEIGASVTKMGNVQTGHDAARVHYVSQNIITESEIVHNIQESLQTHVMIDMCNTAARNFWITLVAMLITLFAMLAAWTGVIVDWWCSQ